MATIELNKFQMNAIRFGWMNIGGNTGCCAIDIMQGFTYDPDAKATSEVLMGDSGITTHKTLGPTNKDIFLNRLRIGTFDSRDMPDRAFLVAMTDSQVGGTNGGKWLKVLKEEGFEFIRTINNSVYTGSGVPDDLSPSDHDGTFAHPVYLFGLFRNISNSRVADPFEPPRQWKELPEPEGDQLSRWKSRETVFYTAEKPVGVPNAASAAKKAPPEAKPAPWASEPKPVPVNPCVAF